MSMKPLLIIILTLISNFIYADSNIQRSDIFAFDPSQACDVVTLKLEKMEAALDEKKMTITELLKSLRSAATPTAKYGNILLDYHRTLDQFKSMKKDYDQLILERENHCMPNSNEKSTN
ncbi:hypothetical protein [Acinetobacter pittii]|uniref:hypothetical protein n=1 Tax=Acinetobacter pittii TaxID=48296 RepID=UPI001F063F3B|nr:hypothetical protein [Acinetobacter pittii]MCH2071197.1 hypothetical protein [Acinetobacter pittii]